MPLYILGFIIMFCIVAAVILGGIVWAVLQSLKEKRGERAYELKNGCKRPW